MTEDAHAQPMDAPFRRRNLFSEDLTAHRAHEGIGQVRSRRVASFDDFAGECNFIDYAELAPGTSIGEHWHGDDSEELYLVLSGSGDMKLGEETLCVTGGDLVRNPPGGLHGLVNTGTETLRLVVVELGVRQGSCVE
jgi:mannose-6-phosphate isomerase-like protein (cupin superfamily)